MTNAFYQTNLLLSKMHISQHQSQSQLNGNQTHCFSFRSPNADEISKHTFAPHQKHNKQHEKREETNQVRKGAPPSWRGSRSSRSCSPAVCSSPAGSASPAPNPLRAHRCHTQHTDRLAHPVDHQRRENDNKQGCHGFRVHYACPLPHCRSAGLGEGGAELCHEHVPGVRSCSWWSRRSR
jgi:hypothetical protein